MIFSKQKIFCNICGKEFDKEYHLLLGKTCKVCSSECLKEFSWRETLSILGKDYEPRK